MKIKGFAFVFIFVLLFATSFVSAASPVDSIKNGATAVWEIVQPIAEFVLGGNAGVTGSSEAALFMGRIILFIILLSLVWFAVKQFPAIGENEFLVWVVSVGVSILGIRFMQPAWVEAVILPYSALGIALAALFPLIIYFFFVEKGLSGYPTMRKIAWIFAAVVFVSLFLFRDDVLIPNDESAFFASSFDPSWIYLIAAACCIVFLLFDRTIQKWYARVKHESYTSAHASSLEAHYRRLIKQAYDDKQNNVITQAELERLVKKYQKELEHIPGR